MPRHGRALPPCNPADFLPPQFSRSFAWFAGNPKSVRSVKSAPDAGSGDPAYNSMQPEFMCRPGALTRRPRSFDSPRPFGIQDGRAPPDFASFRMFRGQSKIRAIREIRVSHFQAAPPHWSTRDGASGDRHTSLSRLSNRIALFAPRIGSGTSAHRKKPSRSR